MHYDKLYRMNLEKVTRQIVKLCEIILEEREKINQAA